MKKLISTNPAKDYEFIGEVVISTDKKSQRKWLRQTKQGLFGKK